MKVNSINDLREGEVLLKWASNRLFNANKNILKVSTGPTGSGKSLCDIRQLEIHYKYNFKNKFKNVVKRIDENVCFGIDQVVGRLDSGDLEKGEILLCEEVGTTHGALDFQSKSSKLFNHVLQSFRSKNIGLFMNVPYFSMLNKQSRMLTHIHQTMTGIDMKNKVSKCKMKYLQYNDFSGKCYPKNLRVFVKGISVPIKEHAYYLPSKELSDLYEPRKDKYVDSQIEELRSHIEDSKKPKEKINDRMKHINYCWHELGLKSPIDIAKKLTELEGFKIHQPTVSRSMSKMDHNFEDWRGKSEILKFPKTLMSRIAPPPTLLAKAPLQK